MPLDGSLTFEEMQARISGVAPEEPDTLTYEEMQARISPANAPLLMFISASGTTIGSLVRIRTCLIFPPISVQTVLKILE